MLVLSRIQRVEFNLNLDNLTNITLYGIFDSPITPQIPLLGLELGNDFKWIQ